MFLKTNQNQEIHKSCVAQRKLQKLDNTPWKLNIVPENIPSQKESSLPTIIFQGLCLTSGGYTIFATSK